MSDIYESKLDGTTEETEALAGDDRELSVEEAKTDALIALADTAANLSRAVQTIAAYTPTVWVDNSEPSINATRLNHIEKGIQDATAALNNAINAITEINGSSFMPRSSAPNSVITENTNIDNIKIPGSYTSQGANIAGERRWGNFTVFNDGNYYIVQEFTNNDKTKLNRVYSGDNNGWGDWFEFATKGDLTTSGQIGWTNSEISNGVTKNFDASNYLLLVAETGTYSNVAETIIVTSSYFLSTSLGKRIMLNYDGSTIEVYHGTGNEVHIRGTNIKPEQTFRIYGVLAKS